MSKHAHFEFIRHDGMSQHLEADFSLTLFFICYEILNIELEVALLFDEAFADSNYVFGDALRVTVSDRQDCWLDKSADLFNYLLFLLFGVDHLERSVLLKVRNQFLGVLVILSDFFG